MISPNIIWIGLILLTVGLYGVVKFWPEGGSAKTFSQHAASRKSGIIYYILLFTITLPIFAAFFFYWFIPTYKLPVSFGLLIALALGAQYLCTLVPEIGIKRKAIHRGLAFISALGLLLAVAAALLYGSFSLAGSIFLGVGLLIMTYLLAILITTRAQNPKILYIQAGYFAAFFVTILLTVYL